MALGEHHIRARMEEQRQRDARLGGTAPGRVDDAVGGGGVVAARGLLQHVADIDDEGAKVARHVHPFAIGALHLQPRLVGGGQNGEQVDILVGGGADGARLLGAIERRIVQHPQQGLLALFDHRGEGAAVVSGDIGRGVLLDPAQQLGGQTVGEAVVLHRLHLQFFRHLAPGVDVEVLLDVFLAMALGHLGDRGGEVAILGLAVEQEILLLLAHEEAIPVVVDGLHQLFRNGVVGQHAKAGGSQGFGEALGRIG